MHWLSGSSFICIKEITSQNINLKYQVTEKGDEGRAFSAATEGNEQLHPAAKGGPDLSGDLKEPLANGAGWSHTSKLLGHKTLLCRSPTHHQSPACGRSPPTGRMPAEERHARPRCLDTTGHPSTGCRSFSITQAFPAATRLTGRVSA